MCTPPNISTRRRCANAQAVYTALKETESRATDLLPLWKLGPLATALVPRQVEVLIAVLP